MHKLKARALAIGCALSLASCAAQAPRVERMITNAGGVVVSNAPAVNEEPEPRAQGGRLVLDYGLFAENIGATRAVLDLVSARAALAQVGQAAPDAVFRIACLEREATRRSAPIAVLEPGERTRIDCEIELTPELAAPLASAERELVLALPVHTASAQVLLYFDYKLHAGDAP